tara:strand:+ start:112 stop:726 length:615 start_codon:yes stop_codon:yes gene_type:complete
MSIDYLRDVKEWEDAGLTDEQIAQHLSSKTAIALDNKECRVYLQEQSALKVDPITNNNSGSLIDYYSSMEEGEDKHLLGWFITNCLSNDDFVSTDEYPRSVQLESIVSGLPVELEPLGVEIIAIGEGQPHLGTTVADVEEARQVYEDEQAAKEAEEELQRQVQAQVQKFNAKRQEYIQPLIDASVVDDNSWIAAIEFMASTWSE